eukprot:scaffold34620_cov149-Skeletonema_dohrnii-CCMP3373.AAC.2
MREAAKKTIVPKTDFVVDSVKKCNALVAMSTALPKIYSKLKLAFSTVNTNTVMERIEMKGGLHIMMDQPRTILKYYPASESCASWNFPFRL